MEHIIAVIGYYTIVGICIAAAIHAGIKMHNEGKDDDA